MKTKQLPMIVWALAGIGLAVPAHAARVELEAENPSRCNVTFKKADKPSLVHSGGYGLAVNSSSPIQLAYSFEVSEAGNYTLRVREYYPNGRSALRWRVDGGPWRAVKQGWDLVQTQMDQSMTYSEWGEAALERGQHMIEIESTAPVMRRKAVNKGDQWYSSAGVMEAQDHRLQMDLLIFTTDPLVPTEELARLYRASGFYKPHRPSHPGDWYELPMDIDTFAPSPLDGIHPSPKPIPTDASGVLRREGDHFLYPDGRRFHIWGLSVPTAPPKQDARWLAKRLRRLGITVARFHSLDGGLCDINTGKNYQLCEDKLDRMEFFIARLREEGIYSMLDPLYNWQAPMMGAADGLPESAMILSRIKAQFYIDPYLQGLNKDFLRKILTRKNPYTRLVNGKDPAIAFLTVVNENSIFLNQIDSMNGSEPWRTMLTERFNQWLLKKYGSREKLAAAWGPALKPEEDPAKGTVSRSNPYQIRGPGSCPSDNAQFLYDVQVGFYNSVKDYVAKDLGCGQLLFNGSGWFGAGWLDTLDIAANLPGMDFFDQHGYGPLRSTMLRPGHMQPIARWPHYSLIEKFASRAPAGYPMVVTEWNNGSQPDGPMMMAAYGALNGWDGLFQYSTDFWFDGWRGERASWAQAYMQYPLAMLAFCQRHIAESGTAAWRYVTPPEKLFDATRSESPVSAPLCGFHPLIGKCEWAFDAGAEPIKVDPAPYESEDGEFVNSMTGELRWRRSAGQLQLRAPKLQGLVGSADGSKVDLGEVEMTLQDTGVLSVCLGALDGEPLGRSKRILLIAAGETKSLRDRTAVEETFADTDAPEDWATGGFTGAGGVNYQFVNARSADIGAGRALALKSKGEGELRFTLLQGAQRLSFQIKPIESGEVELEVLVDGKVRTTTPKENIKVVEVKQDPRLHNQQNPDVRDIKIEDLDKAKARPGAEVVIRTTTACAVPVGLDNLTFAPLPDEGLGTQIVMRPPVGEITFKSPVKAARALDMSGLPKGELQIIGGNTIRLDNTPQSPWIEITR